MTRLQDIRARLAAATPGPWTWDRSNEKDEWGDCGPHLVSVETEHHVWTHPATGAKREYDIPVHQIITASGFDASSIGVENADADLIAHAPADLAALTAALDAVLSLHRDYEGFCGDCGGRMDFIDYPCPTVKAITQTLEVHQ